MTPGCPLVYTANTGLSDFDGGGEPIRSWMEAETGVVLTRLKQSGGNVLGGALSTSQRDVAINSNAECRGPRRVTERV